ncbi:MAG: S1C family serine protease [Ilumatobacteraceae bacterium]
MGNAVWVHSEPPLAIGRGLLVTTGAIGGLLSLAVLWAMLPSTGSGGQAGPTVLDSTAVEVHNPVVTVRPSTLVATSIDARLPTTTLRAGSGTAPKPAGEATTTTPAPSDEPPATEVTQMAQSVEAGPVAVGIGDSLIITTARAVQGRSVITLHDADGQPHDATVLMVDRDLGLAFLSADAATMTKSYGVGPAPTPGDVVTVVSATPKKANVGLDADGHLTLDAWGESTPEGAPVVNADGLLVGICTHGSSGLEFVSVANLGSILPTTKPAQATAWLGVKVMLDGQGALVVYQVDPEGAAAAGVLVGDVITAVDGMAVANRDQLKSAITAHAPDDVVALTVTHAGEQTSADIDVTLGIAPSM